MCSRSFLQLVDYIMQELADRQTLLVEVLCQKKLLIVVRTLQTCRVRFHFCFAFENYMTIFLKNDLHVKYQKSFQYFFTETYTIIYKGGHNKNTNKYLRTYFMFERTQLERQLFSLKETARKKKQLIISTGFSPTTCWRKRRKYELVFKGYCLSCPV